MAPININGRWVVAQRLLSSTRLRVPLALAILLMGVFCVVNLARLQQKRTWDQQFEQLTGIDLHRCPNCHVGHMVRRVVGSSCFTDKQPPKWNDSS